MDGRVSGGYKLIYSNSTLPGMSGSPIFDSRGIILGVHGRGELEAKMTQQTGIAIKTGQNQGVPLNLDTLSSPKETIYLHSQSIDSKSEQSISKSSINHSKVSTAKTAYIDLDNNYPTEAELQALLQGFLDAKALMLSGQQADLSALQGSPWQSAWSWSGQLIRLQDVPYRLMHPSPRLR